MEYFIFVVVVISIFLKVVIMRFVGCYGDNFCIVLFFWYKVFGDLIIFVFLIVCDECDVFIWLMEYEGDYVFKLCVGVGWFGRFGIFSIRKSYIDNINSWVGCFIVWFFFSLEVWYFVGWIVDGGG